MRANDANQPYTMQLIWMSDPPCHLPGLARGKEITSKLSVALSDSGWFRILKGDISAGCTALLIEVKVGRTETNNYPLPGEIEIEDETQETENGFDDQESDDDQIN